MFLECRMIERDAIMEKSLYGLSDELDRRN